MFAEATNQKIASELSVELLQTFAVTLERLALQDDKPRSALPSCGGVSCKPVFCLSLFYYSS